MKKFNDERVGFAQDVEGKLCEQRDIKKHNKEIIITLLIESMSRMTAPLTTMINSLRRV